MTITNGLPEVLPIGQLFRSCDRREYRLIRIVEGGPFLVTASNVRRQYGAALYTRINRSKFHEFGVYSRGGTTIRRMTGFYAVANCLTCDCCERDVCGDTLQACTPMVSEVLWKAYSKPGGCPCNANRVTDYRA